MMRTLLLFGLLILSASGRAAQTDIIELLPKPANPQATAYRGWVALSKTAAATDLLIDFLTQQAIPLHLELENKIYRKLTTFLLDPEIDYAASDIRALRDQWLKNLRRSEQALRGEVDDDPSAAILADLEKLQFGFRADLAKARKFLYIPAAYRSIQQSQAAIETAMMLHFEMPNPALRKTASEAAHRLVRGYMSSAFKDLVSFAPSEDLLKDLESLTGMAQKDLTEIDFRLRRISSVVNRKAEHI